MQNILGDLFGSPIILIVICIGIVGLYFLLTKTGAGKKIGWFCVLLLILTIWASIVPTYIMPNTGITYGTNDYNLTQALLILLPTLYFIFKGLK